MDMFLILIILLAVGSLVALVYFFVLINKDSKRLNFKNSDMDLAQIPDPSVMYSRHIFGKIIAPVGALNSNFLPPALIKAKNDKLMTAEVYFAANDFFALQEILGLGIFVACLILLQQIPMVMIIAVFAGLFAFWLPEMWLNKKIQTKKLAIVRSLPYVVDLLSLAVGAGLDFMMAISWIIEKTNIKNNETLRELSIVLQEIKLGRQKKEALKNMSKRLNIPEITSFVRTLVQSDRMGTSLEEAFKILSEDTRRKRFQRGERLALQAPLKMLIPLIFCILPTVMIIVAGPVLLQFLEGGGLKF